MKIDDPDDAYVLADKEQGLRQAAEDLAEAERVYEAAKVEAFKAEAAKRDAHKKVAGLRDARNAFVVDLAPHYSVVDLADIARVAHSQVSRLFSTADKPPPKSDRRGTRRRSNASE